MHRVGDRLGLRLVDSSGEGFRTKTAMHEPFLGPGGFQGRSGYAAQPIDRLGETEGYETVLDLGIFVGIEVAQYRPVLVEDRLGPVVQQDQGSVQEGLEKEVVMDPLGEVTAVADVAWGRIPAILAPRRNAALDLKPLAERGHEIVACDWRAEAL